MFRKIPKHGKHESRSSCKKLNIMLPQGSQHVHRGLTRFLGERVRKWGQPGGNRGYCKRPSARGSELAPKPGRCLTCRKPLLHFVSSLALTNLYSVTISYICCFTKISRLETFGLIRSAKSGQRCLATWWHLCLPLVAAYHPSSQAQSLFLRVSFSIRRILGLNHP